MWNCYFIYSEMTHYMQNDRLCALISDQNQKGAEHLVVCYATKSSGWPQKFELCQQPVPYSQCSNAENHVADAAA